MSEPILTAIVTAGGTREPIDDVRVVSNLSSGRLGAAIAIALIEQGVRTTLITGGIVPAMNHRGLTVVQIRSTVDLQAALDSALETPPSLLFMAAAVSDYAPVPHQGKIRSNTDELVIRMTKNPKILPTLRARCPDSVLVGFKLLSGVTKSELVGVAHQQAVDNHLDATVANDLQDLTPDCHPAVLVRPGTDPISISGTKTQLAYKLVKTLVQPLDPYHHRRLAQPIAPTLVELPAMGQLCTAKQELHQHFEAEYECLTPILSGGEVAGLLLSLEHEAQAVFIRPSYRKKGLGTEVARRLSQQNIDVVAPKVDKAWWVAQGWRVRAEASQRIRLSPPGTADTQGASILLVHGPTDRVLIGRRKHAPGKGAWAFPGGHCEPGETKEQTALRELQEETGIALSGLGTPHLRSRCHLSSGDGETVFELHTVGWLLQDAPEPHPSAEMDARWIPLAKALKLHPMPQSVRRLLHQWVSAPTTLG